MRKREAGFSLIELIVVVAILGFVLAAISEMFVGLLRGFKQQSKITETNIEGVIGLEMLRRDIQSAGYGLPWIIPGGTTYSEATNAVALAYNDASDPPRALLSGLDVNNRAYLVIKAINVARNETCTKWTHLLSTGATTPWTPSSENLQSTDKVIVISPGTPATTSRTLVVNATTGEFFTTFSSLAGFSSADENRIVYGVDPNTDLIMPFNRADYYVSTSVTIPGRCAPGTGVLMKAIVNQGNGGFSGSSLPLLDCVADIQVVTYLDQSIPPDGIAETFSNGLSVAAGPGAAQTIRDQLKEVRVYILAHEGQRDTSYTHTTNPMLVGESATLGRNFDFTTNGITNWQNYRWKVYTLVVRPNSLN